MKRPRVRRSNRLAPWIVLGYLVAIVLVACARERLRDPGSAHLAVRAQSARPLSVRPSPQPLPAPALPGYGVELGEAVVCRMESGESAPVASIPLPAELRHEYPRGPPGA